MAFSTLPPMARAFVLRRRLTTNKASRYVASSPSEPVPTEELYLDDHKTWTHLLQEGLAAAMGTRVEVVNTGLSGLRSPHHLVTLNHISRYQPDLVLILMGVNDWNHQILEAMDENRHGPISWWKAMNYHDTALGFIWRKIREAVSRASTPSESTPASAGVENFNGDRYAKQNDSLSRPQRAFLGEIKGPPGLTS